MKIWTVTFNDDNGVDTQVVTSQQEADELFRDWLFSYEEKFTAVNFDQKNYEIFDALCEQSDFMDSCSITEHDVHPPFHKDGSIEAILIDFVPDRRDGDLEVDENAIISFGEDPGAYVQCWKWISWDHVDEKEMALIMPHGTVWYFDLFEEFMKAWDMAPKGSTYTEGTPELKGQSGGSNDAEEFANCLEERR